MPFSIRCGPTLLCLPMLPFLHARGISQCTKGERGPPGPAPNCCMTVSKGVFNEPVTACFEQKENTIRGCRVHAYVFRTETKDLCVDTGAWWIPRRLKRLEQRGVRCQII